MAQKNPFDQFDEPAPTQANPFNSIPLTGADPAKQFAGPQAEANLARLQQQIAQENATAEANRRKAVADADKSVVDAAKAKRDLTKPDLSSKERSDAIAGYQSGLSVERLVADLEGLYAQGPGSTKGIKGYRDYLPLEINRRFDNAGNAARGNVGTALGFTGGQLNTATEAAQSVGPYLPKASDTDGEIRDKMARLRQLAIDAKSRSVQILGGVPDANGVVTKVPENQSVTAGVLPTGRVEAATGATRQELDPVASGIIDRMVRQGGSLDSLNTTLANLGYQPVEQRVFDDAQQHFRQNPGYKGSYGEATKTIENTLRERVAGSPTGAFAANAFNDAGAGLPGAIFGTDALNLQREAFPNAALAGSIVGGVAGSGALELGLGGAAARLGGGLASRILANPITADAAYGGIQGGLSDGSAFSAIAGAGLGAGGGVAGRAAVRGVGSIARGVTDPSVQYLRNAGVPLTSAQAVGNSGVVGRAVKGVEDRLTSLPLIGDIVNARRLEGFQGFNRAAFDEGLRPIRATTNGATGEAGIDVARAARSQAYGDALDNVQVQADAPFVSDMQAAIAAGRALPDPMRSNLDYTLPTRVGNSFGQNGGLTGRDFQQSIRGLRRDAKSMEQLPYGYDFGQVTRQAEGALEGLLDRQAAGALPAYRAANAANRNVEVLRDAVTRARNGTRVGEAGLFAPSQLGDAAAANARRFGNSNGTTNQPFFDLARAGQNVLPSRIADSGTAGRLAVQGGLGLGLGALGIGGGYAAGGTDGAQTAGAATLGLGALLAAGGTRLGQRAITRTLLDRPDYLRRVGNQVARGSRLGGMFGAATALPLLTYE